MHSQLGVHYSICVCMLCMGICGSLCALFTRICFHNCWLLPSSTVTNIDLCNCTVIP